MLKDSIRRTHVLEVILACRRLLIKEKCNLRTASRSSLTLLRLIATMSRGERKQTQKKELKETGAEKMKPAQVAGTHQAEMCCSVFEEETKIEKKRS